MSKHTQHTPGPWRWTGVWLEGDGEYSIVRKLTLTTEADKALIAAAPEMLEALIAASALLARHGIGAPRIDAVIAKAKAEGKD